MLRSHWKEGESLLNFNKFIHNRKALAIIAVVLAVLLVIGLIVWRMVVRQENRGPMVDGKYQPVGTDPVGTDDPVGDSEPPGAADRTDPPPGTEMPDTTGPGETTEPEETDPEETEPERTEPPETVPPATQPDKKPVSDSRPTEEIHEGKLICREYALFSGQFVEDGRDELVEWVAAILVKNDSDQFLDLATLTYDIDGQMATFIVTGLPAGKSAWVMEATRMQANHDSVFTYVDCISSFKSEVLLVTTKVTITAEGNMLTATNNTGQRLEDVCVYYRNVHSDGNYFGGITYLVSFGTLEPGQSAQSMAGHYKEGVTEIIRYGWKGG